METPAPTKSASILQIIGGLYILFGSFTLVSMLSNGKLCFAPLEGQTGLMADMLRSNPSYASIMRALFLPGLVFAVVQFGSGVGLLRLSALARKVAIGCALYGFAAALFTTWLTITYTLPFTLSHTLQQVKNPAMMETTRNITLAAGYVGIVLGLLYPLAAFILLKRIKIPRYSLPPSC
ncbi:hypothetical protein [Prosthecobacter fluviatilis]|uniref:DUF4386 domain-containing protein n=1 Tax=Prosthecobacter fluviatilis TaxID=445931 RepID=A0ABW0KTQ9_9BACT